MSSPAKRPAPEFRPPAKRSAGRRGLRRWARGRDRRLVAAIAAMAVLLVLAAAAGAFLSLRGGGAGPARLGAGTTGGREVQLPAPASRYVPQLAETPTFAEVYPPNTFSLSPLQWAANGLFQGTTEGEQKAQQWGYSDGYQADFWPIDRLSAVVKGAYYITVESYLFDTQNGARQAYQAYEDRYRGATGSEPLTNVKGLGNQSSAWRVFQGVVGTSELRGVYYRFAFRRGNLVAIVQTYGAEPFMTIDRARELAVIIDEKALGQRPSPSPTPRPANSPQPIATP